jgi:hypothetical protein
MALNQEEWYKKLRAWTPTWFFECEKYNDAAYWALAKVFATVQANAEDHVSETFITEADEPFLDLHGDERNVVRLDGETNPPYANRIRALVNTTDKATIKAIVDGLLLVGECVIIEHAYEGAYFNRGSFCNRNTILTDRRYYNAFTVIIERQVPTSNSFLSRLTFASRSHFLGTSGALPPEVLLNSINVAIASAKALGVSYRIIEK